MAKIRCSHYKLIHGTSGSAGYDLCTFEDIYIDPCSRKIVSTGVHIDEMDDNLMGEVRPRSSMSLIGIDCCIGTIDSDYRGVISVILVNTTNQIVKLEKGRRIAQLVFTKISNLLVTGDVIEIGKERGTGGFGSTGK